MPRMLIRSGEGAAPSRTPQPEAINRRGEFQTIQRGEIQTIVDKRVGWNTKLRLSSQFRSLIRPRSAPCVNGVLHRGAIATALR